MLQHCSLLTTSIDKQIRSEIGRRREMPGSRTLGDFRVLIGLDERIGDNALVEACRRIAELNTAHQYQSCIRFGRGSLYSNSSGSL
jgi:hypothetical protein